MVEQEEMNDVFAELNTFWIEAAISLQKNKATLGINNYPGVFPF